MVQFFRSGPDDRRRRVLADDTATQSAAPVAKTTANRKNAAGTRNYANEALREHQPRLIDYIPQKLTHLFLLFVLGLAIAGGLEAVYFTRVFDIGEKRLPAFDLTAEGNLNNWYTSILLDVSALVALAIYSLRRHRLDDYHGHYRVWLAAAACWLWLSVDEAGSLHESLQTLVAELAGQRFAETELVWIGAYGLIVGGISLRLLFEMRSYWLSTTAFVLSGLTLCGAIAAYMSWLPPAVAEYQVLIEEGCEMLAGLFLLCSMCLHARHVILDSQGLLPAKPAKEKAKKDTDEEQPAAERRGLWGRKKTKVDPAHTSVRPASKRVESDAKKNAVDDDEEESDDDSDEEDGDAAQDVHTLSKAERKALRRQQERARKNRLG